MTVKEIIEATAVLSGREDVVKYLSTNTANSQETIDTVNTLLKLLNMVISELSSSFLPLTTVEVVNNKTVVKYSELTKNVIEILKVYDNNDKEISFKSYAEYLNTSTPCGKIEYRYHPKKYTITDQIDYTEKDISGKVLVYGLLAEFALSEGDFDGACNYHDLYVEGVHAVSKPKNSRIQQRSWA